MSFADYLSQQGYTQQRVPFTREWIQPDYGSAGPFPAEGYSHYATDLNIGDKMPVSAGSRYGQAGWFDQGGGFQGYGSADTLYSNNPALAQQYIQHSFEGPQRQAQIFQNQQVLAAQAQEQAQERQLARQQYANSLPTFSPIQQAPVNINSSWGQPAQQNYSQPAQGGMLAGLHRGSSGGAGMLSGGLHRGGNQ